MMRSLAALAWGVMLLTGCGESSIPAGSSVSLEEIAEEDARVSQAESIADPDRPGEGTGRRFLEDVIEP